jgi:HEAT repeat protein
VCSLEQSHSLIDVISDEIALNPRQAEILARVALERDASFISRLTRTLAVGSEMVLSPPRIVRILDVLSRVAQIATLRPTLARLSSHENLFVRSKSSLILARSHGNSNWIRKQFASKDARIRANAIESGWGLVDEQYRRICRDALLDENNRVQGNALVGLHRCSDENWADNMIGMASHKGESFRITAAWAMGYTGDACFIPVLQSLVAAGPGQVRWHAMRAISRIRKGPD